MIVSLALKVQKYGLLFGYYVGTVYPTGWARRGQMKIALMFTLVVLVGLLSGVGQASIGGTPPISSGTLVLLGTGVVGFAVWGRRKFRR
jgi:hypothetical protein